MAAGSQGRRAGRPGNRGARYRPEEDYYVEHKDMLFLIPSEMQRTVVKRVRRVEDPGPSTTTDCGWGSVIPPEILHRIFQLLVEEEGALPTLCRQSQVCRLWRQVASSPDLWQRVSVSRCWVVPGKKDPPRIQEKARRTIEALIQQRLSQVSDFSLHHWKSHITFVLQCLASSCPLLTSLTLSHCSKVTAGALECVGSGCPLLTSLNLQNSQMDSGALSRFLTLHGAKLRCLYLSCSFQTSAIISLLAGGSCPELRVLEVIRLMTERFAELHFPAEGLQSSCPQLEVLRLLNVIFSLKSKTLSSPEGPGFRCLQELCLATNTYSVLTDAFCKRLLRDCTGLRVLDLRGCYRVTPEGLCELPCADVQRLYLGMYCSVAPMKSNLPSSGCSLLTRRWRHCLQELDLTGQIFSEDDLSRGLNALTEGGSNGVLQSLSLTGTKVSSTAVRNVLLGCRALTHLDISSCRNIPRGLKCNYRGPKNLRQCLEMLSAKMQEEAAQ